MIVFLILLWGIWAFVSKKTISSYVDKLFPILVIVIFSLQPSIINSLLRTISCTEINHKLYLRTYLSEECDTPEHKKWIYQLFIPSIVLYAAVLPMLILAYMIKYRRELYQPLQIKRIGYISIGYSENKFYWYFFFIKKKI